MLTDWDKRWAPAARMVSQAETDDFARLIEISGLDPVRHLRFADWADVNFAGCDLRGFDFTGACLIGCNFEGALIGGARFDQAEIDNAGRESIGRSALSWSHGSRIVTSGGSPFFVREPVRQTNLRAATDWEQHVSLWGRPNHPVDDTHLRVGAVFQDAPFAPELVVIPAGRFLMDSSVTEDVRFFGQKAFGEGTFGEGFQKGARNAEGPQHEVTIPLRLAVGRYPVTFEEWDFASSAGITYSPVDFGWGRGRRPVIDVSWDSAQDYLRWLREKSGHAYRLLSEAEWEYCCRAGSETQYAFGDDEEQLNEYAWYSRNSGNQTHPVGEKNANCWGLYDMHGNVNEWCEDVWVENHDDNKKDGSEKEIDKFLNNFRSEFFYYDKPKLESVLDKFIRVISRYIRKKETVSINQKVERTFEDLRENATMYNRPEFIPSLDRARERIQDVLNRSVHVVRGGAWDCNPDELRSAYRYKGWRGRYPNAGFRVARTLTSLEA